MFINSNKFIKWLLTTWSLVGIICVLITVFLYLKWFGFAEQGEVNFAALSSLLNQGYPLYTDIDSAERYSLQHGPIVYLLISAILKVFGSSYVTAKLSGVAALLLSLFISWLWFSNITDKKVAVCLVGLETWILLHWYQSFLIRPDSLMILCVVISMYIVTTRQNRLLLIFGIAVPLGIMINLKIHGVLYFLPVIAIAYQRLGWKNLLLTGCLALLLGVAPFLSSQVSFKNYMIWLSHSVKQGVRLKNFIPKVAMIFVLSLVPVFIGIINGINMRSFYMRHKRDILALLVSLVIPSIIASKPGSGTNHLMPFMPIFVYIIALLISDMRKSASQQPEVVRTTLTKTISYVMLALISITITFSGIHRERQILEPVLASNRVEAVQEIESIEKLYVGKTLEVGYGENKSYCDYRDYVPLPVFHGNPLLIEAVGLYDMHGVGLSIPASTINKLEEGAIQVWLIPAGNIPFALTNAGAQLFDESFRQAFFRNYKLISYGKFFDVWVYKNCAERI